MIDFTVFEKKKKLKLYRRITNIVLKKKKGYLITGVFDHRSEEQTLFQSYFNPLSPNSDQHQFSPNNIHTFSRNKVMRINEMITKEKMRRSFIRVSQLIRKGNVWGSVWRICMWILGLKGLKLYVILKILPTFFSTKF